MQKCVRRPILVALSFLASISTAWAQVPATPPSASGGGHSGSTPQQTQTNPAPQVDTHIDPYLKYAKNVNVTVTQVETGDFPTVRAFVNVTDENGAQIRTLRESDFTVEENGEKADPVQFANRDELDLPLTVVFVVDISGSMGAKLDEAGTTPLDLEIQAVRQFVSQLQPRDRVALIAFSDAAIPEVELTTDHERLLRNLDRLTPWGQTTLWDAVMEGMQMVLEDDTPARRALIVLSDGLDNKSTENPQTVLQFYDTESEARNIGFSTYALGLGSEIDRGGLGNLVTRTGGLYMEAPKAQDLADLYQDILNQIQNEYLLEYQSPVSSTPGQIIDLTVGVSAVSSFTPGHSTYRSPGLSQALARAIWPGIVIIAILLAILVIATIFKLSRRAWLTVMITPFEGKDYAVSEMGANIGNSEVCEVRLSHDPALLPLHASITESMDGFVIEAADPANSPIVAGRRALARKLLRNGERFSLGHTTFVFHEKVQRPGEGMELAAEDVAQGPQITEESQQHGRAVVKAVPHKLVCDSGPYAGTSFELAQGDNTIGRADENTIAFAKDNQVSRKHCTIKLEGSSARLTDHGSTNGTAVNGVRCQPQMATTVAASDILVIGTSTFHLE